ncbi:MAG: N-terminal phage integrase SAM-like domain-containing protein [Bacteroidota bacterium]
MLESNVQNPGVGPLHELNAGEYVEPSKLTFGKYLDRWLADYVRPNLRPKTAAWYEGVVKVHLEPALGGVLLARLSPLHLQRYYNEALQEGCKGTSYGKTPGSPSLWRVSEPTTESCMRSWGRQSGGDWLLATWLIP